MNRDNRLYIDDHVWDDDVIETEMFNYMVNKLIEEMENLEINDDNVFLIRQDV